MYSGRISIDIFLCSDQSVKYTRQYRPDHQKCRLMMLSWLRGRKKARRHWEKSRVSTGCARYAFTRCPTEWVGKVDEFYPRNVKILIPSMRFNFQRTHSSLLVSLSAVTAGIFLSFFLRSLLLIALTLSSAYPVAKLHRQRTSCHVRRLLIAYRPKQWTGSISRVLPRRVRVKSTR